MAPIRFGSIMNDERFDHADLTATILDLGRRGYIELTESEQYGIIGSRQSDGHPQTSAARQSGYESSERADQK